MDNLYNEILKNYELSRDLYSNDKSKFDISSTQCLSLQKLNLNNHNLNTHINNRNQSSNIIISNDASSGNIDKEKQMDKLLNAKLNPCSVTCYLNESSNNVSNH